MRTYLTTYAYSNASALQLVEALTAALLEGAAQQSPVAPVIADSISQYQTKLI